MLSLPLVTLKNEAELPTLNLQATEAVLVMVNQKYGLSPALKASWFCLSLVPTKASTLIC